jgi:hypothetical protein
VSLRAIIPVLGGDCSPGGSAASGNEPARILEIGATPGSTDDSTHAVVDVDSREVVLHELEDTFHPTVAG